MSPAKKPKKLWRIIVAVLLGLLLIASATANYSLYTINQRLAAQNEDAKSLARKLQLEIMQLKEQIKQLEQARNPNAAKPNAVVFTFDDGPYRSYSPDNSTEHTEIILDILKKNNIKATFFVLGCQFDEEQVGSGGTLERYKKWVKRVVDEGHTLSIHDYNHIPYWKQSREELEKSFKFTSGKIREFTGVSPSKYVRSPGGSISEEAQAYLKQKGLRHVYWNIEAEPLNLKTSGGFLDHVKNEIAQGQRGIILMHDRNASGYLADLIKYLNSKNIKIISLAEWDRKYALPKTPYKNQVVRF
ncbi:MAG: polysaccharide deacetylase family protein [Planctomycetes bacterium]|nr:polysaccharide deacetylase family protein [Planctomycetota bacterium]